ncbi:MAG: TolC family protein [Bacteroidales bacterium]|nr:TolC family protein [Bacteroidales bacterium]
MKTRFHFLVLIFALSSLMFRVNAQSLQVSSELKELIELSLNKDYKVADKDIDKKIAEVQRRAVRSAYIPKIELGGKYLYAYSSVNSKIGEVDGFESIAKLKEFMTNPAFPVLFPNLAGLSSEITKLQQLLAQQGMQLPSITNSLDGDLSGNYFGVDVTTKMLLYSGGQVPNAAKALSEKIKAQEALSDKCKSDVISDVITYYDQLALLIQSKKVLNESTERLVAEKKYANTALRNGLATTFDTLKIAVADANLHAKLSEYDSKKTLLYQKLAQLTGKPASSFEVSNPDLQPLIYTDTTSDINNRAEFRALTAGVEAQKYMLKSEKSHYLPKIQALASVRYDNIFKADVNLNAPIPMDMKINSIGLGPTFMVGVGFKWEILDRSGGSAKIQQAKLEVSKADNAREEARELLQLNQIKVKTNYNALLNQVAYKEKQRQAARMALQLAQKSYDEGMINITERLAAETEVQNAELEFIQAVFAQRQSALECYKATGDLVLSNIK